MPALPPDCSATLSRRCTAVTGDLHLSGPACGGSGRCRRRWSERKANCKGTSNDAHGLARDRTPKKSIAGASTRQEHLLVDGQTRHLASLTRECHWEILDEGRPLSRES